MRTFSLGCLTLFTLMLFACGGGGGGGTTQPPTLSGIIVAAGREGTQEAIYKMNPDGTGITKILNVSSVTGIRLSPDKQKVVWTEGTQIKCVRLDGTGLTTISSSGIAPGDFKPTWGADSDTIVYTHRPNTSVGTAMISKSSMSNPTVVTTLVGTNSDWAEVNPAGTKVVFCDFSVSNGRIQTCNLDGTGLTTIYPATAGVSVQNPHFSRDGGKVIFMDTNPSQLIVVNADGTGATTPNTNAWWPFYRYPISADNTSYFATTLNSTRTVSRVNIETGAVTLLASSTTLGYFDPVVSPDGNSLAISSTDAILIMGTDGSNPTFIGGSVKAQYGDWK